VLKLADDDAETDPDLAGDLSELERGSPRAGEPVLVFLRDEQSACEIICLGFFR
jgi:hypothetical protein